MKIRVDQTGRMSTRQAERHRNVSDRPIRCGMWTQVASEEPTRYTSGPGRDRGLQRIPRK